MTSHSVRSYGQLSAAAAADPFDDLYRDSRKRSSRTPRAVLSHLPCAVQVPQLKLVLSSADNSNIFSLGVNFISSYNPRFVCVSPASRLTSTEEHLNSGFQHKFPTSLAPDGVSRSCAVFRDFPRPLPSHRDPSRQLAGNRKPPPRADRRGDATL